MKIFFTTLSDMALSCLILFTSLFFVSCAPSRPTNFIKVNYESKGMMFSAEEVIYYAGPSPNDVLFFSGEIELPEEDKANEFSGSGWATNLDLNKYLISKDSPLYDQFIEVFNLKSNNNYGFNSPADYFASEYNDIFVRVMSGESLKKSRFAPLPLKIKSISRDEINYVNKEVYAPFDSLKLNISEPEDLEKFCREFLKKHTDAEYVILSGSLYIVNHLFILSKPSANPFSNAVASYAINNKTPMIIAPKVIIDVKNSKIICYHLGRKFIDPDIFDSKRTGIQNSFIEDALEVNLH